MLHRPDLAHPNGPGCTCDACRNPKIGCPHCLVVVGEEKLDLRAHLIETHEFTQKEADAVLKEY